MFRNRGELPNISNSADGGYRAPHYSNFWNGRYIVIRYDWKFVAIEIIMSLLIILIAFAVYLFAYKVSFEDPIASIKTTFLNIQLISIGISLIFTGLVTCLSKSKENLIKNLRIVALISILVFLVLLVTNSYLNNLYNETTFGEFYEKYEQPNNTDKNQNTINIGLSGIKVIDLKKSYIDKSVSAYTNFSIKVFLLMILHILVIILILYLSYRLYSIERKKEKLAKDDKILFDEEQNIRF